MSNNLKLYIQTFCKSLSIQNQNFEDIEYNTIDQWDSIGHMTLIADLEEAFQISFETDDIVEFSSFKKGMEILSKYKISF